jgi:Spy/CpxP family protein refolding chaperone
MAYNFKIMEKYFTKIRVLTWVVIALAVLNIATLSSIFWHKYQFRKNERSHKELYTRSSSHFKVLNEKLKLNKKQGEDFNLIHKNFRQSTYPILGKMSEVRNNMIEELKKEKTDTVVLYKYAQDIGDLHMQLKKQTVQLYLQLKSVCTPQQQDSLAIIMAGYLQNDGMTMKQGKGIRGKGQHSYGKEKHE